MRHLSPLKEPMLDEVISIMKKRPGLKERASTSQRIIYKIVDFVETFINGMG